MRKYKTDNKLGHYGETDLKTGVIKVNKSKCKQSGRKGELLDTIVHETLHKQHPKAGEKSIIKKTDKKTKSLTTKQKKRLYSKFK